jgi:DNA-binding transcriptional ArsR family regulator
VTKTTSEAAAELDAALHRALSDPSRVQILKVVQEAETPLDARELGTRVGLHVNTVRSHLRVLAEAGLVSEKREERARPGRPRILYEAAAAPLDAPAPAGYRLLAQILASSLAGSGTTQRSRRGGRTGMGRPPRPPTTTVYVDLEGEDDRPGRPSPQGARLQPRA